MGKTKRDTSSATEAAFHKQYAAIWGKERWQNSLYPALAEPTRYAALVNRYASASEFERCIDEAGVQGEDLEDLVLPLVDREVSCVAKVYRAREEKGTAQGLLTFPPPRSELRNESRALMTHWNLDASSILAAHISNAKPGEHVLDLCAAPGGKSIALAQSMWPDLYVRDPDTLPRAPHGPKGHGYLHANESDPSRHHRLSENLKAYLPERAYLKKQVSTTNIDAALPDAYRKLPHSVLYDKMLVDAPCSSERHIIHASIKAKTSGRVAPEMTKWRLGSSKRLQETQGKLLMTALRAVRMGGTVVYATCSIESGENDGVVEKVLALIEKERRKGVGKWSVKVGFGGGDGNAELEADLESSWAERTKLGWIVLPDHAGGGRWGPLFFVVLTKVERLG